MALKNFTCACGRSFEALTQFTVTCPQCGAENARPEFTPCTAFSMGYDFANAHPLEIESAVSNKRKIEAQADKVRSGAITLRPGKNEPSYLRPELPKLFH